MSKDVGDDPKTYTEENYTVPIDHFDYSHGAKRNKFNITILYNISFVLKFGIWDTNTPILVYTGNEGDIKDFWSNSGFVTNHLAKELNAAVLFIEHRYYGKSIPFDGNTTKAWSNEGTQFLRVE
jgi:lysosomal Pro-X carboxypeptidase